jgi:formylglycine-generating enzyme required for sulfatase activity
MGAAKRGDLESAVELYTKALEQRDEPGLRVELAKVSAMLEAKTKERALQAKVDDLLERAREARAKGDLDKALDLYREAARDSADVREDIVPLEEELARRTAYERSMKRARELVGQNKWKEAASVLNEVLQSRPADAEAARLLAEVEGHLGPKRLIAVDLGGGVSLPLIYVSPGRFVMGSNEDDDEKPAHEVVITRGFYMGKYELTQAQCQRVMGMNPSKWKDPARPVERVSWNDAAVLCRKLSEATGRRFRLPTEAEWEYACRAGSTGQYGFGDDASVLSRYAHYSASSGGQTQRVGGKLPNAWGLHDMHGNVWEWCRDRYSKSYYASSPTEDPEGPASGHQRVLRGGSWYVDARLCRSPNRGSGLATSRTTSAGLRVVCDP